MYGIDISRYDMTGDQKSYTCPLRANTEEAYQEASFVIIKATNGESYAYEHIFEPMIERAAKDGKCLGAYHYAKGGDPVKEADYFLSVVGKWKDRALLFLDWESSLNASWGSVTWAREFAERIHEKAGVWPWIYTGNAGVKQCEACYPECGLWFAGYPDDRNEFKVPVWPDRYKTAPWPDCGIWQYSSSGGRTDRDYTAMTAEDWNALIRKEDGVGAIDRLISVAEAEIGYLEKKSNSNLDSKTGNAGSGNYTKYWRDLYKSSYNGAWCQAFVDWCFRKAFGEKTARSLLHMETAWSFYTPTAASYFKSRKQWYTSPKRGDVIYFKNSQRICHVGIVWKVSGSTVYTIEGNTSGASGVIANGGGVCKKSYGIGSSYIAGYGRPDYAAVGETVDNSVAQFERWANEHYPGTTKNAIGRLLNPTGKWAENDNDRLVALAIWKYIARDDFGAKVTPGNRVFGAECRKAAAKMVVGYGYKEHPDLVRVLQGLLAGHGLYDGEIDGVCGAGTCAGIQAAERKYGLTVDSSDAKKCSAGKQVWEALLK